MAGYFTDAELACSCGCDGVMNDVFMQKLNQIRADVGQPFVVTSAYRCGDHNSRVSSTGLNGPHTTGRAIDIRANSRLKSLIFKAAIGQGITRFGMARTFIHIDDLNDDAGFGSNVIWTY